MLRSVVSRCLLIVGLSLVYQNAASTRQITNGNFEGGTYSQNFGASTDILPNGWTNAPPTSMSNINVFANGSGPGSAQSGTHYLAFQSAETDGTQDCLNQTLTTVPNQKYTMSFWVSMTASAGSVFGLSPEWDSGGANDTVMGSNAFYYHPINSPAVPWTFFSFTETASSSSTSVYFYGADGTGAVLLDNVTFAACRSRRQWPCAGSRRLPWHGGGDGHDALTLCFSPAPQSERPSLPPAQCTGRARGAEWGSRTGRSPEWTYKQGRDSHVGVRVLTSVPTISLSQTADRRAMSKHDEVEYAAYISNVAFFRSGDCLGQSDCLGYGH